jgi:hypothetical protein
MIEFSLEVGRRRCVFKLSVGSWTMLSFPSWPGLSRPSTSLLLRDGKDVDARHKAGHDDLISLIAF